MTQEEIIKDLEQRIAIMDADNSALCSDLAHLKKVAAGQKGRMTQMSLRLHHLENIIKEKDAVINGLESQVSEISTASREKDRMLKELKSDVVAAEANLEYYMSLPWWRRIFV